MTYVMIKMPDGSIAIEDNSRPASKRRVAAMHFDGGKDCGTVDSDLSIPVLRHGLYKAVLNDREALQDRLCEIFRISCD